MRPVHLLVCFLLVLASAAPMSAQVDAIRAVMDKSAADWNRGDLDTFATAYKNSPDILFISRQISKGYAGMLASYHSAYGTPEKMGRLSFSEMEVQPLDAHFATLTGKFHLERTTGGGGNRDGFYLLVFEKTARGWKIIRDDSTTLPAAKAN